MNRIVCALIALAAIGGTGCAALRTAFGPQIHCTNKAVPLYWADGRETSMSMQFCGYNVKVRK